MQLPHSNPVGLSVVPGSFTQCPRESAPLIRVTAVFLLVSFLAVVSVTTAVSLGGYCLTSDTADTRSLPPGYLGH
jgi:hypothetical protein